MKTSKPRKLITRMGKKNLVKNNSTKKNMEKNTLKN